MDNSTFQPPGSLSVCHPWFDIPTTTTTTATDYDSTQHYSTLITLHYINYTTLRCNYNYTTLHYNYNYTTSHTLHQTTLHYATLRYTTLHDTTLHYITLHYFTTTTPLHYNCTTPHYIQQLRWGDHTNHCNHFKKHNSNHLSVHQWIRSAIRDSQQPTFPIGFLFLKLPPPPCAVLLVYT